MVVDACRKYFPKVASGLDDKRVTVRIADGLAYMKELNNEIDIAIIDSTDPIGPGEGLFSRDFYKSVAKALRPGGLMVAQSESPWYTPEFLGRIQNNISGGFSHRKMYIGAIPTYPRGFWSWTVAANQPIDPASYDKARFAKIQDGLEYLTPGMMTAVFELPPFIAKKLNK